MFTGLSTLHDDEIRPVQAGGFAASILNSTFQLTDDVWNAAMRRGAALVVRSNFGLPSNDGPMWLPRHRAAWETIAKAFAAEATRRKVQPVLWPLATDVVSDVPGLLTFLRGSAGMGWKFLCDPAGLFTRSMLTTPEDHLSRMAESLPCHPACAAVLLRDALDVDVEAALAPTPLSSGGRLTPVLTAANAGWLSTQPIVLLANDFDAQFALINRS